MKNNLEIEAGGDSVYEDLQYANAEEMQVKAQLAAIIAELLQERGLSQTEVAVMLGMTQPKLSNLLRGQFRGISEFKMLSCLMCLGGQINIQVKKPRLKTTRGHLTVSVS